SVGREAGRELAAAERTRKHAGLRGRDPAEGVGVLTSRAGHDVLAATQEEDGLRIRIVEVDRLGRAGHRDPAVDLQLGVALEPYPTVTAAPVGTVGAVPGAPILEPPVDDHFDRRVIREGVPQRPTHIMSATRHRDQYRALTVLHGLALLR